MIILATVAAIFLRWSGTALSRTPTTPSAGKPIRTIAAMALRCAMF